MDAAKMYDNARIACNMGRGQFNNLLTVYDDSVREKKHLRQRLLNDLKLAVIAEGVETKVELMRLQSMGCDLVQGYYFSRPLPAADYEELIRKSILL